MYSLVPFKPWQNFLIHSHIQGCRECMSRLASREEVMALIIRERDVEDFRELWPAIKAGVAAKNPKRKFELFSSRKWAFIAAGVITAFLAVYLLVGTLSRNGAILIQEGEVRFQINSIQVGGESATPFLYQPKDSDMILVWAEKGI